MSQSGENAPYLPFEPNYTLFLYIELKYILP